MTPWPKTPATVPEQIAALGRRLTALMLLRVLLISLFLGATLLLREGSLATRPSAQTVFYLGVIVATYLITILYAVTLTWRGPSLHLAYAQLLGDFFIASALVVATGGFHSSPFLFTLYLPVIAAAFVATRRAALLMATLAALLTLLTAAVYIGWLPAPGDDLLSIEFNASRNQALLEAGLNISFTYLLALSSGQLARKLDRAEIEIAQNQLDLRALRTLNEDILASLNSGLLTIDASSRVIFLNRAAETITGLTLEESLSRHVDEIFPGLSQKLVGLEAQGARHELRYAPAGDQAEALFLGFSSSPLRDASGVETGSIIIFQDLSTYKELENKAQRNEKLAAIGQLAASIAHEIRNPLASISGSVEMLKALSSLSPDEDALMGIVLREVERLNTLISQFLEYSRPPRLKPKPTDLVALLKETLRLFGHHSRSVALSFDLDAYYPQSLRPEVDAEALQGVIWNVLINAAQAMSETPEEQSEPALTLEEASLDAPLPDWPFEHELSEEPFERTSPIQVRCQVDCDRAQVLIEIEDDGPGIDDEAMKHIFEPFFTTKQQGTGLGLATAFRLIEAHRGELFVTPAKHLNGARFVIALPLATSSPPPPHGLPS